MSSNSNIAVIIASAPSADVEASELVLALAAFDLPVKLFFIGAGVLWLVPQEPRKPQGKAAHKVLNALPMYGIEKVYYRTEDAAAYALNTTALVGLAQATTATEMQAMLTNSQHCFTF